MVAIFRADVEELVPRLTGGDAANKVLFELFKELFVVLPEHLRAPAHKALSRVLHPDTGGDHECMVALGNAWREIGR